MITAQIPGFTITRNQSFFKPTRTNTIQSEDKEMEYIDQHEEKDDKPNNNEVNGENNYQNRGREATEEPRYPNRPRRAPNYYKS